MAQTLIRLYKSKVQIEITGKVRKPDVKHCYADITKISRLSSWRPKVKFTDGLRQVITWSEKEKAVDLVDVAMRQLEKRGLR